MQEMKYDERGYWQPSEGVKPGRVGFIQRNKWIGLYAMLILLAGMFAFGGNKYDSLLDRERENRHIFRGRKRLDRYGDDLNRRAGTFRLGQAGN